MYRMPEFGYRFPRQRLSEAGKHGRRVEEREARERNPMKRQRKGQGIRAWIAALSLLIAGTALALGVSRAQDESPDIVGAGVRVDGLALGGKTRAEAARALHDLAERKLLTPILLHAGKLLV